MKFIFIFVLSICSLFLGNSSAKAAEQINIIFEEMKIPINIDKLTKLEQYEHDSKEVIGWFKKNGFSRVFELTKFLKFPIFKQEGLNRELLRSWVGRKILSELSKTIIVPNDKDGIEVFNTIENLLDDKSEISTLDIIQALPSEEILLDIENLILIISSWKKELIMQQNLILKLNELKISNKESLKRVKENDNSNLISIQKKIYAPHRVEPVEIEYWKSNKESSDKELIIFMPGLGGDINNFKWIGKELSQKGWPVILVHHKGSNSKTISQVLEGKEVIPGSTDFFFNRIKDLDAVLKEHRNGSFGLDNDSYILMGHSLGALISLLYEGGKPLDGLENRCDNALTDFGLTNLSKFVQCQLSEITLPKKIYPKKANAIIGFNAFGSLIWPKEKSSGIDIPILLIGGTYDLITPLIGEQFKVFLSANNSLNRFLIIEGASHFSPIRIENNLEGNNDIFKIRGEFIGADPKSVQDLSLRTLTAFINNLKNEESLKIFSNKTDINLDFHLLDRKTINEISKN